MRTRTIRGLAVVGSVAAIAVAGSPAVAYAGRAATPTLTGSVLNGGRAVAGATVAVQVWPNGATLTKIAKAGKRVHLPMLSLGETRTGGAGTYAIAFTAASVPAQYWSGRGADRSIHIQTTVAAGADSIGWQSTALPTAAAGVERFDLARGTVADSNAALATTADPMPTRSVSVTRDLPRARTASPDSNHCYTDYLPGNDQDHHQVYGQQNGYSGVDGWLEQEDGHNETMEIAANSNDADGWSVDGSATVEIDGDNGSGTPKHQYSRQRYNTIATGEFEHWCSEIPTDTFYYEPMYMADLDSLAKTELHPFYGQRCIVRGAGAHSYGGSGTKWTASWGMTVMGVHLGTSDIYTTEVVDNFYWHVNGHFCGDNPRGTAVSAHVEGES